MARLIVSLISSFALSSSTPSGVELADLIPKKLDQALEFFHSLQLTDNSALTSAIDAMSPLIHHRRQEVGGFVGAQANSLTWNQLVELQAATSTTLMCLHTMGPLIANEDDKSSLEDLVSDWKTIRGQAIHVVEQTDGTVNELPTKLLDETHSALVELGNVHSRITERLGNSVKGLPEFKRINAHGSFESSRELFEDWSIRRIEFSTVGELRDMLRSAAGTADSLAQSAELYNKQSATIDLGREFKKIIIRLRLYLTQIPDSFEDHQLSPPPPKMVATTADLAVEITGKIGQVVLMFKAVNFLSANEAAMTEVHIEKLKLERSKVEQCSKPDELFMICSRVAVFLELYGESAIGRRNSWVNLFLSDLMQLRLKAAHLLTYENVSEVPRALREDARVILVEMRRVLGTVASSPNQSQLSHSLLILAALNLDEVAVKKIMLDQASSFLDSLNSVVTAVEALRASLPGTQDLKPLIVGLRTVARRTRSVLKKRKNDSDLEEVTAMEPEPLAESGDISSATEEYATSIPGSVSTDDVKTALESFINLPVSGVETLESTVELSNETEWLTSRRDIKRLRGTQEVYSDQKVPRKESGVSKHRPNASFTNNGRWGRYVETVRRQQRQAATTPTSLTMSSTRTWKSRRTQYPATPLSEIPATRLTGWPKKSLSDNSNRQSDILTESKHVSFTTALPSESLAGSEPLTADREVETTTEFVPSTVISTWPSASTAKSALVTPDRKSETRTQSVDVSSVVDVRDDVREDTTFMQSDYADEYMEYPPDEFGEEMFWAVPQRVTQMASRIRILSDTLRSISTEMGGLAAGAFVSTLDEATRFNIAVLCHELTSTQYAIDRLRITTSGFEAFANELPPDLYPIVCPPYPPRHHPI